MTYQYRVGALRNNGYTVQNNDWSDVVTIEYEKEGLPRPVRAPLLRQLLRDLFQAPQSVGHDRHRQQPRATMAAARAGKPTKWANLTDLPNPDSSWFWYCVSHLLRECYDVQFRVRANYTDGYESLWVKISAHWGWHSGHDLFAPQGSQSTVRIPS